MHAESLPNAEPNERFRTFNYWNPDTAVDPYPLFHMFREQNPVAYSEELGGYYILSRYEHVNAALRDHARFTSTVLTAPAIPPDSRTTIPPLDQDPPSHSRYRQLLLPFFTPSRAAQLEAFARSTARELATQCTGPIEAYGAFCFPMPTVVLSKILGVDAADLERFARWITLTVDGQGDDPTAAIEASLEIREYLAALLTRRRDDPRDDILTFLLSAEINGQALTDLERLGIAQLLLIAGIDTTANTLGSTLLYLAEHPDTRARLIADDTLVNTAIEEFLRAFAPVSLIRGARVSTEMAGCPITSGSPVYLSIPSANRDERHFHDPERVILDRCNNSHIAFGAGVHRCLGAHIARMELRVGLEEFLRAIPNFRVIERDSLSWKPGPIRGPNRFHLLCG